MRNRKGSLTLEAVLILPIFMAVVLFFGYFIRVYLIQDMVQDALTEAVMEVSSLSYPYALSGAAAYREDTDARIQERMDQLSAHFGEIAGAVTALENAGEGATPVLEDGGAGVLGPEEVFNLAKRYAASRGIAAAERVVVQKLILTSMGQTLSGEGGAALNRLAALGIEGGLDGFDFDGSAYYADGDMLDIRVTYEVGSVDPFGLLKGLKLQNRAVCRAWMSGVDIDGDGRISRVTGPSEPASEEEPQEDRQTRTCYIIQDSSASSRYHLVDCPNLRVRGDPTRYKPVIPVQVDFVGDGDYWRPEGPVTVGGRVYDFCGNCQNGYIRMRD